MIAEIVVTSSNPQLTVIIKKVAAELGEEVEVVESTMEDANQIVQRLVKTGKVKVVISRAGTGELIRKSCNVPVVNADSTDYDILRAVLEAKKLGQHIGFMAWEQSYYADVIPTIEEVLNIKIQMLRYNSLSHAKSLISLAAQQGIDGIIVGGIRPNQWCREVGIKTVMIANSGKAIKDALKQARGIIDFGKRDMEHSERLKAIVNSTDEGIIALDSQYRITLINEVAERMFAIEASVACGNSILDYPIIPFVQFNNGQMPTKVVFEVHGLRLVAGKIPVIVDGQKTGSVIIFRDVTKILQLEEKIRKELYQKGLIAKFRFEDMVMQSAEMKKVMEKTCLYAETDSTLLITGESGTGKELIAQGAHLASKRQEGPFVAVNCAALPENLLESELFGYEDGAFTGAKKGGKPGLFELAHGGTIFLDEIGTISLNLQGRLLRVLQEREVMRVGGDKLIPVDIRVISATNEDLRNAIKRGSLRKDLYFRLNVLSIQLPPLRSRKEDIPILFSTFIQKYNAKFKRNVQDVPPTLFHKLNDYQWPGNVRELENLAERYVILSQDSMLNTTLINELFQELKATSCLVQDIEDNTKIAVEIGTLEDMEKQLIAKVQEKIKSKAELADRLGISRTTLWKKIGSGIRPN